jgi:hypothetical protein
MRVVVSLQMLDDIALQSLGPHEGGKGRRAKEQAVTMI